MDVSRTTAPAPSLICRIVIWVGENMPSTPYPLSTVAGRRAGLGGKRTEELSLANGSYWESGPYNPPRQNSRAGSGDVSLDEPD